jgi:hypothetical protein
LGLYGRLLRLGKTFLIALPSLGVRQHLICLEELVISARPGIHGTGMIPGDEPFKRLPNHAWALIDGYSEDGIVVSPAHLCTST